MVGTKVKTSVIIPVYNTEKYLRKCIKTVLSQAEHGIEIILVDDGSSDGSRKIIKEYLEKYSFIKSIYQKNQKQGAARNAGLKIACGKYIYFLDSDDYISDNLFEVCYQIAEKKELDFLMFDAVAFVDEIERKDIDKAYNTYSRREIGIEDKVYSGVEFWNKYYKQGGVYVNAYLTYINAQFLRENNLFFEPEIFYEDNDWMLRMYLNAKRIAYFPGQLYYRRFRVGSTMTSVYSDVHLKSIIVVCKKLLQMLFDEVNSDRQKVICDRLEVILQHLKIIFESYCKRKGLDGIKIEIVIFYKYLLDEYFRIIIQYGLTQIVEIREIIRKELRRSNIFLESIERRFEEHKSQVMFKVLQKYPLHNKGVKIGIYGTGKLCEKFLGLYRKYIGEVSAELFFIHTYEKNEKSYKGYPLYNYKEINNINIEKIIIASARYKDEMLENIRMVLSDKIVVLFVPEYLLYLM